MAEDPLVVQAELLAGLIRDNDAVATRMLRSYAKVYQELVADWQRIIDEIDRALLEGGREQALPLLRFRAQRIQDLKVQTAHQIDAFARQAERLIEGEQQRALEAGQAHAAEVTAAAVQAVRPGVRTAFTLLPTRALSALVGKFSNGMPLPSLLDQLGPSAAQDAYDAMFRAVALGINPRVAARQLRTALGIPLTRALTISRTEMLGAYRTSTLMAYNENSNLVRAWRWNAHLDVHTCPSCWALHNSIHPLSEWMHEHVNGRCVQSPVLTLSAILGDVQGRVRARASIDRTGPDRFSRLSEEEKRTILGPGKYELMRSGKLDLGDLVQTDHSALWGLQYREASITQALFNHQSGGLRIIYSLDEVGL